MDESGIQTVPSKLTKSVAPTGQGQTVTLVCAMSGFSSFLHERDSIDF